MDKGRILVLETDPAVNAALRAALQEEGHAVRLVGSAARARSEVEEGAWDLAIVGLGVPEVDGVALVGALRSRRPDLPILVLAPAGRRAEAHAARAAGACGFLEPPHDLTREKILMLVANALEHRALRQALAAARVTLNLVERERQAIREALELTKWNKQAAAKLLGLHRPTLYSKMRKHGIPQKAP